jgi:hypothetical protein
MEPKKWYLISKEDADEIREALELFTTFYDIDSNNVARDALHTLDSGLHATDAVPDDWRDVLPAEKPDGSTESRLESAL